jgi:hypothetical protein
MKERTVMKRIVYRKPAMTTTISILMIYEKKLALIRVVPLASYLLPCQFFLPIQKKINILWF